MGNQPDLPLGKINAFMTAAANVIVLILLFRSHQPAWLKLGAGVGEAVGLAFIFGFFLGERRRWVLTRRETNRLERELEEARERRSAQPPDQRQRDAA